MRRRALKVVFELRYWDVLVAWDGDGSLQASPPKRVRMSDTKQASESLANSPAARSKDEKVLALKDLGAEPVSKAPKFSLAVWAAWSPGKTRTANVGKPAVGKPGNNQAQCTGVASSQCRLIFRVLPGFHGNRARWHRHRAA